MSIVHIIHGIRTEPDSPVKNLIPYLSAAGYTVRYPEYGFELALETRILNPIIVGIVKPYIGAGDLVVGHSNGCAVAHELMKFGAPFRAAIFINGALNQNFVLPDHIAWADCYFNADDDITEAAKIGAEIGIVDGDWGELGHLGYTGRDPRITSIDCGRRPLMPAVSGHSDFFTPQKLAGWAPFLISRLPR